MARVVSTAVAGVDPAVMGVGPVPATRKALERAGIGVDDLDLVELNEAFASQSLVCIDELGLDPAKVNVNGGAIALGHPLGMSGGRLITMLTHELRRTGGRYGLATMCIGVGQGIATIVERIDALTRPPEPHGTIGFRRACLSKPVAAAYDERTTPLHASPSEGGRRVHDRTAAHGHRADPAGHGRLPYRRRGRQAPAS